MNRALGIPAAAVVLVALPSLVAQPTAPEAPPAKEAALTVNLEGDQGAAGHPYDFAVTAQGAPPAAPATLRDATGLHTAIVRSAHGCGEPQRVGFADGRQRWCLRLEDVAEGYALTGAAIGGDAEKVGERKLSLTVNRRDSFLWLPLLAMLAGFLAGAIAVFYKSAMRKPIRSTVLGRRLRKNERAPRRQRIAGLTKFAGERLDAGEAIDDLIPKVDKVIADGPAAAKKAREELAGAVEKERGRLAGYAVWRAAEKEAQRTDHRVEDFYKDDATAIRHPALELNEELKEVAACLTRIEALRKEAGDLEEDHRKAPAEALERAEFVARRAAGADEVKRLETVVDDARDAVEAAWAKEAAEKPRPERMVAPVRGPEGAEEEEEGAEEAEAPAAPAPSAAPAQSAAELGGAKLGATERLAIALTVVAIAVVLAVAVITVKQSAYDPKLTFGSFADYVSLFLASLGSSAAGSVLVLLGLWSAAPTAED